MAIASLPLLIICLWLFVCLESALSQTVPSHNCGDLFSYMRRPDGSLIGVFTPLQDGLTSLAWSVTFTAHGSNQAHTVSSMGGYPDKESAFEKMRSGGRGQAFVRFQDYGNELPKLIRAELNGHVYCSTSDYDAPSSTMTRGWQASVSGSSVPRTPATMPTRNRSRTPATMPPHFYTGTNPFLNRIRTGTQLTVAPRIDPDLSECGVEGFAAAQAGGETITRGRFPWLGALYEDNGPTLKYSCVVSLVSKRTVITAAHCIHGKKALDIWVYVGRHDRNTHPESGATLIRASSTRTPSQYDGNPVPDSDVGIVVLDTEVVYTNYIRPICLWTSRTSLPANEGDVGAVAGWGLDENAVETRYPKAVNVRVVTREQCLTDMKRAEDFITPNTLCAGNSNAHGPCLGDSGGGLMIMRNGHWTLRGIVALAPRKGLICDLRKYVIYCDIAKHLTWIESNIVY
ncbi:phenoloxidase-activating factor 1 [Drosophila guanche]|uniref:Blast:Serine protease gd n=1 Tax=Drosophila guanche TaxID=7266 RepID=A0A3B0K1A0_DROGU|nr:phenoloxidase-activating factor 1 [Drosophila guanche]SPP88075.1 blast:Serine protease gd [Drosophila guanche]